MAHIQPLPPETTPELAETFGTFEKILGFIPNSLLTMQRRPGMVAGFEALTKGVMDPNGEVDLGFKRLVAHFCSRAAGCQYCMAHSLIAAEIHGIPHEKVQDIWNYHSSDHYSDAERAALDYALAAGAVPNDVDDAIMTRMREHWSDGQIVEILGVVCLYGFLNRWNDSMATSLETSPKGMMDEVLAPEGFTGGKHV